MRDTVTITAVGNSIGFTLSPSLLNIVGLELGDSAEIEIYEIIKGKSPREVSIFMTRKIITIGGGSKGVTIKKIIKKQLNIDVGDIIGIDLKSKS